jgi:malonyl-CoA O-methyltransferase
MKIHKEIVRKHFDRHAHEYDQYARVQVKMLKQLIEQLPTELPERAQILEIGCGTGRLTEQLRSHYPTAQITALDLAPAMLEQARNRLGHDTQLTLIAADAEQWMQDTSATFDLIVSNATFQWFEQPIETLHRLKRRLNPHAELHFSTLGPQTFWEFHQACSNVDHKLGLPNQRRGQRFLPIEQWQPILDVTEHYFIEYHDSVRTFMDSVRRIGASKADDSQTTLTKTYLRELQKEYERHLTTDYLLPATYHAIFGTYVNK